MSPRPSSARSKRISELPAIPSLGSIRGARNAINPDNQAACLADVLALCSGCLGG